MNSEPDTADGDEIWLCPVCGRELMISWRPEFMCSVLVAGDEGTLHTGFKAALEIEP